MERKISYIMESWEEFVNWHDNFFGGEMPISFFRLAFVRSNNSNISLRIWAYKYDNEKAAEKRQK